MTSRLITFLFDCILFLMYVYVRYIIIKVALWYRNKPSVYNPFSEDKQDTQLVFSEDIL